MSPENLPDNTASKDKPFGDLPPGISKACGLIFVYSLIVALNAVWVAFQNHKFGLLSFWLLFVFWTLRLTGNLAQKEKWAWWAAVVCGALLQVRYVLGILVWFIRQHRSLQPQPQQLVYYMLCSLMLFLAIPPLLKRESRDAFGFGKPKISAENFSQPPIPEP